MKKPPKLTLVDPDANPEEVPATLKPHGATLWAGLMKEFGITDRSGRVLLLQICHAVDRVDECREVIDREGMMIQSRRGSRRCHPLLKVEISSRSFVVRGLSKLGVVDELTPRPTGRPVTPFGWGVKVP